MVIDRRLLLELGVAALVSGGAGAALGSEPARDRYVSAARRPDGRYVLVIVTGDGRIEREIAIEARGHDIALSPDGRLAVAFGRGPARPSSVTRGRNPRRPARARLQKVLARHGRLLAPVRMSFAPLAPER